MKAQPKITNTSGAGALAAAASFGSLIPSQSMAGIPVQFLLWSKSKDYHVDASATFSLIPTAADSNGDYIKASDIGIGITSIVPGAQAITPRTDVITAGYGYDPQSVTATNGLTPFLGAARGSATLADLSGNRKILSGKKIGDKTDGTHYLAVTIMVATLPQYFTPGTFTSTITLTIADGP